MTTFKIGDKVTFVGHKHTVIAVDDGWLWVKKVGVTPWGRAPFSVHADRCTLWIDPQVARLRDLLDNYYEAGPPRPPLAEYLVDEGVVVERQGPDE